MQLTKRPLQENTFPTFSQEIEHFPSYPTYYHKGKMILEEFEY